MVGLLSFPEVCFFQWTVLYVLSFGSVRPYILIPQEKPKLIESEGNGKEEGSIQSTNTDGILSFKALFVEKKEILAFLSEKAFQEGFLKPYLVDASPLAGKVFSNAPLAMIKWTQNRWECIRQKGLKRTEIRTPFWSGLLNEETGSLNVLPPGGLLTKNYLDLVLGVGFSHWKGKNCGNQKPGRILRDGSVQVFGFSYPDGSPYLQAWTDRSGRVLAAKLFRDNKLVATINRLGNVPQGLFGKASTNPHSWVIVHISYDSKGNPLIGQVFQVNPETTERVDVEDLLKEIVERKGTLRVYDFRLAPEAFYRIQSWPEIPNNPWEVSF